MQNTNDNFDQRAAVHGAQQQWTPSPMPGVERIPLDRIGVEVARATSLVKYEPGSSFKQHIHKGGEEYLVLQGTFQDEHGDFPTGTYVRNPIGSRHTPLTEEGCIIFVKLWQFEAEDQEQLRIDTHDSAASHTVNAYGSTIERLELHKYASEDVRIENWGSLSQLEIIAEGGMEIFVLDGSFQEAGEDFQKHSWLRLPKDSTSTITVGLHGAKVYVKSGHLFTTPQGPQ